MGKMMGVGEFIKVGQPLLGCEDRGSWVPQPPPLFMLGYLSLAESAFDELVLQNRFLATLNGARDVGKELKANVEIPATRKGTFRSHGLKPASDEEYSAASDALQATLVSLVDEWIGSGFDKSGVETPFSRKLEDGGDALKSVNTWLWHTKQYLRAGSSGMMVVFSSLGTQAGVGMAAHDVDDPSYEAATESIRLFILLMESAFKYHIAYCFNCRKYYFRKKPRKCYKRSSYCYGCRSGASAKRRIKEVRQQEHREKLQAAAKAVEQWPRLSGQTRARYGDEHSYILSRMKKYGVTGKWIAMNMTKVEQFTGAANAKG